MEMKTYYSLKEISNRKDFGKICQLLLTLSFYELGYQQITLNIVEGVDILLEGPEKYAIEVKTTTGKEIHIGKKDYEGLKRYKDLDYVSILCVLQIDLPLEWRLINFERFEIFEEKATWKINRLFTSEEFKELSKKLNEKFEFVLKKHIEKIKENGLRYLSDLLKKEGIKYTGK